MKASRQGQQSGDPSPQKVLNAPGYQLTVDAVLAQLSSDPEHGLSDTEARARRERFGPNLLQEFERQPVYQLYLRQFTNLLITVLCVSAALAWYLGDLRGATILMIIIIVNAVIGLY